MIALKRVDRTTSAGNKSQLLHHDVRKYRGASPKCSRPCALKHLWFSSIAGMVRTQSAKMKYRDERSRSGLINPQPKALNQHPDPKA